MLVTPTNSSHTLGILGLTLYFESSITQEILQALKEGEVTWAEGPGCLLLPGLLPSYLTLPKPRSTPLPAVLPGSTPSLIYRGRQREPAFSPALQSPAPPAPGDLSPSSLRPFPAHPGHSHLCVSVPSVVSSSSKLRLTPKAIPSRKPPLTVPCLPTTLHSSLLILVVRNGWASINTREFVRNTDSQPSTSNLLNP